MTAVERKLNMIFQETNARFLGEGEALAKAVNPVVWYSFPYKDNRQGQFVGTVEVDPQSFSGANGAAILGRRKLRVMCCFMNVAWNTDLATTKTALNTAVTAMSV